MKTPSLLLLIILASVSATSDQPSSRCSSINYPSCARNCQRSSLFAISNPDSLIQLCGLDFRVATEICEAAVCSRRNRTLAGQLDATFCEPVYQRNATLASAVSAAIASSTPIAIEATRGKDATKLENFPPCAQDCIIGKGLLDACGSLSNRSCICTNRDVIVPVAVCERTNCSAPDVIRESALANKLCAPLDGILANENGTAGVNG